MVEEDPAPPPAAAAAASLPSSTAPAAASTTTSTLAPLPSIPKKVPSQQPVASGSGGAQGGGGDDVVMRPSEMPDEGKMFIGGLNWETTDESLKAYFAQFGSIDHCTIMRDPTGRSRGFAFLTYFEKESVDKVVAQHSHTVDGKVIDPKRAIPHQEHKRASKVFIGGLLPSTTTEVVKEYFSQFGVVLDAQVMVDRESARSKGFGFVTFADETGCDKCLAIGMVEIEGKQVEVKRAQPRAGRDGNPNNPGQNQNNQNRQGGLPGRPGEYRPQPLMNNLGGSGMQMPMGGGGGAGMIGGFPGGGMMGMGGMGGGMGMGMGGMGGMGMDQNAMQQMYQRMMGGGMMPNQMNMMGGGGPRPGMMKYVLVLFFSINEELDEEEERSTRLVSSPLLSPSRPKPSSTDRSS
ncbi:hypothetical protein BDY24DRAFT_127695 [Mrakia frigida]|uniref:RNA-binding protein n=1 Tax=Mrakia frigida TaxID=29902 RepID=UPI003FCC14E0